MTEQLDDNSSFFDEMDGVKPLSQDKVDAHDPHRAILSKQQLAERNNDVVKSQKPLLTLGAINPVSPDDFLSFKQPGIQDGVFKNLRLGKYTLDYQLNLAGLTLEMSAIALFNQLQHAHQKGLRAGLIRHGKGKNSTPFPALKKSYVNHWLRELDCVIAFHTAQPLHGGLGATYVLLKKHAEQKLINRERNRRR
jgi:DNA-nicking Smr family endonuclease